MNNNNTRLFTSSKFNKDADYCTYVSPVKATKYVN